MSSHHCIALYLCPQSHVRRAGAHWVCTVIESLALEKTLKVIVSNQPQPNQATLTLTVLSLHCMTPRCGICMENHDSIHPLFRIIVMPELYNAHI